MSDENEHIPDEWLLERLGSVLCAAVVFAVVYIGIIVAVLHFI